MTVNWNFPNNGCGQIRGISDAGIETFTGTEIQSLAREICQNSLDAIDETASDCVHVEFERYRIDTKDIPGCEIYSNKIHKAYKYWSTKRSAKTISYLKEAVKAIEKPYTYVLRISDYNTVGLLEPYGDSDEGWNALTKIDGGATKTGDKAGAFGIGKNAPFCNSDYRLVFYRTLNKENEVAAQGVSRFISFPEDIDNALSTMTTGIGYYGNINGNLPINSIIELNNLNIRKSVGTDVFVYGFNGNSNWETDVACEVLDNFLMSIYNNKLTVAMNSIYIDDKNLSGYIERYETKLRQATSYFKVLSSSETKTFTKDFHGLGTLKLRILVRPEDKLNRKILVTRTSGMKLFAIGNISRLISFSGILEMQGKELSEYFREMETPAHDKWVPGRYTKNPEQAKEYHDELKQWIRDTVLSLGEYSSEEEMEVEGLSGVLQSDNDLSGNNGNEKKESLQDTVGDIIIQPRNMGSVSKGLFYGNEGDGKSKSNDTEGTVGKSGFPTTRTLGGNRQRTKRKEHKGLAEQGGRDVVHERRAGNKNQPLENVRIMKIDHTRYKVTFQLPRDIGNGHIEIITVGENGKSNKLYIKDAKGISNCENIFKSQNGVDFSGIKGNEKVVLEFSLVDNRDYAMEVNVYEHN